MAKDESVYAQMIKIWVDDEREMPEDYSCTACTTRCALYFIMRRIIQKNGWREVYERTRKAN